MKLYLAGGLFNAGERLHNIYLEKALVELGHEVILPQKEAVKHFSSEGIPDLDAIVRECISSCKDNNVLFVGCLDGADADSGTSVEYGIAIAKTGRAVLFRTDFRTDMDKEVGINAMFKGERSVLVYEQAVFTELSEVEGYYKNLAMRISEAVQSVSEEK